MSRGGTVLFVGTKKQAQEPVAEQAARVGMPYVNQRWLGGMLTNFQTVNKRLQRLKELEEIDFDDVAGSGFTKKELLIMRREKDKLAKTLGGIRDMAKVPSAVWIVDTNKEHLAVDEARKLGVPVVAILDTNCDPDLVDYAIPGNDDAIRSVTLLTRVVADAVAEGLIARHSARAAATEGEAPAEAEPLAEWERELLAGAGDAAAAAAAEAPADDGAGCRGSCCRGSRRGGRRCSRLLREAPVEEAAGSLEAPLLRLPSRRPRLLRLLLLRLPSRRPPPLRRPPPPRPPRPRPPRPPRADRPTDRKEPTHGELHRR